MYLIFLAKISNNKKSFEVTDSDVRTNFHSKTQIQNRDLRIFGVIL